MGFIDNNYPLIIEDLEVDICLEEGTIDDPTWNNQYEFDKELSNLFVKDLVNRSKKYSRIFTPKETNTLMLAVNNTEIDITEYSIEKESVKAICLNTQGKSVWIPKSQIKILDNVIKIPIWLCIQNYISFTHKDIYKVKVPVVGGKFIVFYINTTIDDLKVFNYSIKTGKAVWTEQAMLSKDIIKLSLRYANEELTNMDNNNGLFYK